MRGRKPVRGRDDQHTGSADGGWTALATYIYPDRLRSRHEGLFFDAKIQVTWRRRFAAAPVGAHWRAADLVNRAIEAEAPSMSVLRVSAAEHRLAAALAGRFPCVYEGLEVVAVSVDLAVDEATERSAKSIERQLYDMELDELARRQAKARADFIRSEVLRDPANARIYALASSSDAEGRLGNLGQVERLLDEVRWWDPESRWITTARLLQTFAERLSDTQQRDLLLVLRQGLVALGDQRQVEQFDILHHTGPPQPDPPMHR
jgi:hypothetical protein